LPSIFSKSIFRTCHASELFIGGDMNLVLDPSKDRSSPNLKTQSQAAKTLQKEIADFKLVDVWREKHKPVRKYSFFFLLMLTDFILYPHVNI